MKAYWSIASGEGDGIFTRDYTGVTNNNKKGDLFIPPGVVDSISHPFHLPLMKTREIIFLFHPAPLSQE